MALLKHAFFTDPKDQSPWNYHEWLLTLLSPVQVVSMILEKTEEQVKMILGLSHKVRNFETMNIQLFEKEGKKIEGFTVSQFD
mmetsp:Transcript_15693/g.15174  ORF Transcript_15693/g.15174 Transcript_15693/m.15174 type:complete len:83 (+) Transcript_15693:143-391(+)|eukprot:CAMPEP_0170561998 /NCGR_PEP_ID=MMETSP0211-20121228/58157_1 /TAXON_ID=311385 /ORGANISM="Pseudokeronopsis sp., Strain OXSARD2" /LENGTH=82 /DNA_ID=CAMNT_0010878291 /DNA_START=133 /DNA_END=381 /DNA_ORIENTATION=-